jgi:hypothetical protein
VSSAYLRDALAKSCRSALAEPHSRANRGLLVGGAVLIWVLGLMWALQSKGLITTTRSDTPVIATASDADDEKPKTAASPIAEESDAVTELVIGPAPGQRVATPTPVPTSVVPDPLAEVEGPPTYPVWFESERNLGVCKITWEGGSKTANLHVSARLPEGTLEFSYQCGKHRGRASIDVKSKRVNGVLFCEDAGDVKVKTVRSKDGRCGTR